MALHVLQFVDSPGAGSGSPGIALPGLFRALHERGVASDVVVTDPAAVPGEIGGVGVHGEDATEDLLATADLLHLHGWSQSGRRVAQLARGCSTPFIVSPMGTLSDQSGQRRGWWDKLRESLGGDKFVRQAATVTAMNAAEGNDLREACGTDRLHRLPFGLTFSDYEARFDGATPPPSMPDGHCLLILGPIHPAEGLIPLLTAFAEIGTDADGWTVVVAGAETGDWRKTLEAAVRRKGGADRVLFTDAPDLATQRLWLDRASLLAAPAMQTRCPVSVLQALAAGVPVIASDCVAPPDMTDSIETCAPNREGLKKVLRVVLNETDEQRTARAAKARDAAKSRFDWSVLADAYLKLYKDLT